jgi:5-hydroxyisourate hydrolase
MGRLTTHVLDTANGRPAAGVRVTLRALDGADGGRLVAEATTNADGRTDAPLLAGEGFKPGRYELVFDVGAYFAAAGAAQADPPFLGQVPVRFGIADRDGHYHVPLLVSPWSYATYRGS